MFKIFPYGKFLKIALKTKFTECLLFALACAKKYM